MRLVYKTLYFRECSVDSRVSLSFDFSVQKINSLPVSTDNRLPFLILSKDVDFGEGDYGEPTGHPDLTGGLQSFGALWFLQCYIILNGQQLILLMDTAAIHYDDRQQITKNSFCSLYNFTSVRERGGEREGGII